MSRLKIIGVVFGLVLLTMIFGFVLPYLISAKSTEAVLIGFGLLIGLIALGAIVVIPMLTDKTRGG